MEFSRKRSFWGTSYQYGIRRFATRIDSSVPKKTKILNPISSSRDLEIIQELKAANSAAIQYVSSKLTSLSHVRNLSEQNFQKRLFSDKMLRKKLEDCYAKLRLNPDACSSSSKLLQEELRRQLSTYRQYSRLWDFQELFGSQDPNFKTDFAAVIKNLKRYYQKPQKCKYCTGKGFLIIEKNLNNDRGFFRRSSNKSKLRTNFKTYRQKCQHCNGKGTLNRSLYYYKLRNKHYADKIYIPLSISFLGFKPGAMRAASRKERKRMKFSHKFRSDINNTYIYTQNPRFPLSAASKLNFVFGKLQEIEIIFPDSKGLYQQMKNRLEDKYGKVTWETNDYFAFCQIDQPAYSILLGRIPNGGKESIVVSCRHKKLSNAKYLFSKLRRKTSNISSFKVKTKQDANTDTGF